MSVSDAEFTAWLARPSARRCLLAEIQHSAGTLYASNTGFVSGPSDTPAHIPYPAFLVGSPTLSESLLGDERSGSLDLYNDGTLDDELTRAYPGWPLSLYLGDPTSNGWPAPPGWGMTIWTRATWPRLPTPRRWDGPAPATRNAGIR